MSQRVHPSDDGERIELGPNEVVIRLSGEDTDGAFSLLEYTGPPDGPAPPRHVHEATDEVIFVLDGTVEWTVDGESAETTAGSTVHVPRGTPHAFSITGSRPAWMLIWYAPAGFEGYFTEMGAYLDSLPPGPPDQAAVEEKAADLCAVYDQTILGPG